MPQHTHTLDKMIQKIIYRSAVWPVTIANPNHRLEIEASTESIEGSKTPSSKSQLFLFDIMIPMPNGKLYAICIMRSQEELQGLHKPTVVQTRKKN